MKAKQKASHCPGPAAKSLTPTGCLCYFPPIPHQSQGAVGWGNPVGIQLLLLAQNSPLQPPSTPRFKSSLHWLRPTKDGVGRSSMGAVRRSGGLGGLLCHYGKPHLLSACLCLASPGHIPQTQRVCPLHPRALILTMSWLPGCPWRPEPTPIW